MKIGYARISTQEQSFQLQTDALQKEGCEQIYYDVASGAKSERPELENLLNQLRKGDVLIVYKLDRLGRSLKHLLELVEMLKTKDIGLHSITDKIDTTTPHGRLFFNISASIAEFERELIKERTLAGLSAARARGRSGGRRKGLNIQAKQKAILAETYYKEAKMGVEQIAKEIGISKMTLYKYLRYRNVPIGQKKKD